MRSSGRESNCSISAEQEEDDGDERADSSSMPPQTLNMDLTRTDRRTICCRRDIGMSCYQGRGKRKKTVDNVQNYTITVGEAKCDGRMEVTTDRLPGGKG